jgi:methylenetetrahydrofolate reductase (NADPH)
MGFTATQASKVDVGATSDGTKEAIRHLVVDFTIETTPASAIKVADFRAILRAGTTVYITFLPGSDFADTITTAKRLRDEGFNPVPHLAVRSLPGKVFLEDALARLRGEANVTEVLCIGGAVKTPLGEFADTMQVLGTGLLDKHGIRRIGVAGHPEGSPDIPDAEIAKALAWKNAFAQRTSAQLYIVTQFCFEAAPIIAWDKKIQAEGNRLPIRIGIPGIATIKTLLGYAKACGIGASMTFLTKHARDVTKLLTTSAPDKLLADLAAYKTSDPTCGIVGCHMYPLGGLKKTAAWSYAVVDGHFAVGSSAGFQITADLG